MKKLFLIVAVAIFSLGTVNAFAQETTTPATEETAVVEETVVDEVPASDTQLAEAKPMHQVLMQKFLEGGWEWMLPVLLCLVFGLAIAIERMLYLSLSTINSKKLIAQVEEALEESEDGESDFMEVMEYLRVAPLLLFAECAAPLAAENKPALH